MEANQLKPVVTRPLTCDLCGSAEHVGRYTDTPERREIRRPVEGGAMLGGLLVCSGCRLQELKTEPRLRDDPHSWDNADVKLLLHDLLKRSRNPDQVETISA